MRLRATKGADIELADLASGASSGISLGRTSPPADVALGDTPGVPALLSRLHVRVSLLQPDKAKAGNTVLVVTDLGALNGTWTSRRAGEPLKRVPPHGSATLEPGGSLALGGHTRVSSAGGELQPNPFVYFFEMVSSPHHDNYHDAQQQQQPQQQQPQHIEGHQQPPPTATPASPLCRERPSTPHSCHGGIGSSPQLLRTGTASDTRASDSPVRSAAGNGHCGHYSAEMGDDDKAASAAPAPPSSGRARRMRSAFEESCICAVCRELVVAPHVLCGCAHSFCGPCLARCLERKQQCPVCRAAVTAVPVPVRCLDDVLVAAVDSQDSEGRERAERIAAWRAEQAEVTARWQQQLRPGSAKRSRGDAVPAQPPPMQRVVALAQVARPRSVTVGGAQLAAPPSTAVRTHVLFGAGGPPRRRGVGGVQRRGSSGAGPRTSRVQNRRIRR